MDVKTKITIFRVLKVISYCAGFPLMALLIWKESLTLFVSPIYSETAYNGLFIALAIWVFVLLAQVGISFLTKKCKDGQTKLICVIAIALIATLLPALVIDAVYGKKISNLADEQEMYGVSIDSYNAMASWYSPRTSGSDALPKKVADNVDEFCSIYNISYLGENLGKNIDGAEVVEDEKNYIYTKPNGMYADGYVFGLKQAMDILIDYHEVMAMYESYAALQADYDAAEARAYASAAWIEYSSTDEFIDNQTEAMKYYVTENKINAILGVLGYQLLDIDFGAGKLLATLLPVLEGLVISEGRTLKEILADAGISLTIVVEGKTVPNEEFFTSLTVEGLIDLVSNFGLDITEDTIWELLEGYSFYLSSYNKPIWDFFSEADANLARFGRAEYYAIKHGALCDSVLISVDPDGKIGKASDLDGDGYPASFGYSLKELYQLRAELSYAAELYPLLSVRQYLYIFSGIIALSFALSYIFTAKQKKLEEEI